MAGSTGCSDPEAQGRRVCCSAVVRDVTDSTGLRCRFGNTEVPAWMEGDAVTCCAPSDQELLRAEGLVSVPLTVYHHDRVLEQRTYEPLPSWSAKSPEAAQPDEADTGDKDFSKREGETTQEYIKREYSALKPFVIISLSYLLFTTTDGAIRMIVLLHAYNSGFTAWEVAIMFTLYELAGVVTNLLAGLMGSRWGIKWTLLSGLSLQLVGISVLYAWQDSWAQPDNKWKAIVFVTFAQMLCGIAKDLTKLGGKTVTKLVTGDEKQTRLFKLVSLITGWKNSLKGVGYFLGAACLMLSYRFALGVLLGLILAAMPWAAVGLTSQLGRARKEDLTLARIFKQKYNINVLSLSRFFLFGSRDMWFEVPLPFFLRDAAEGLGWDRAYTGLFLALFIIVYGQIQSWTPQLVLGPLKQMPANKYVAVLWNVLLVGPPLAMATTLQFSSAFRVHDTTTMTVSLVLVLAGFCLLFAVNSSIHSYLVVRYAEGDKVAMNVGFYYMANALGRLTGTLASGMMYSFVGSSRVQGFAACFWASVAFAATSAVVEVALRDDKGGLRWGRLTLVEAPAEVAAEAKGEVAEPQQALADK